MITLCPCGTNIQYKACCGLYHSNQQSAPTPETLMRSRYVAYTMVNIDYIIKTMRGKPLKGYIPEQSRQWASKVAWLGLNLLNTRLETESKGYVEFIARYLEGDKVKAIHEISEFHLDAGQWYYVDGVHSDSVLSKTRIIGRNSPCPCGSQKKFKNCHEK